MRLLNKKFIIALLCSFISPVFACTSTANNHLRIAQAGALFGTGYGLFHVSTKIFQQRNEAGKYEWTYASLHSIAHQASLKHGCLAHISEKTINALKIDQGSKDYLLYCLKDQKSLFSSDSTRKALQDYSTALITMTKANEAKYKLFVSHELHIIDRASIITALAGCACWLGGLYTLFK